MEKHLKFKRQWFEILNQCDADLRSDVIEAVFQYFFSGVEPSFTDDARKIAFGFIRADIDASIARSIARANKKKQSASAESVPSGKTSEDPTEEENPDISGQRTARNQDALCSHSPTSHSPQLSPADQGRTTTRRIWVERAMRV